MTPTDGVSASVVPVLVVEDDDADAELLHLAAVLAGAGGVAGATRVARLDAAWQVLTTEHVGLVLLDLRLPDGDGSGLLRKIRADQRIAATPVVVLSTSDDPDQITTAYRHGANAYVSKSGSLAGSRVLVRAIEEFWLVVAAAPVVGPVG